MSEPDIQLAAAYREQWERAEADRRDAARFRALEEAMSECEYPRCALFRMRCDGAQIYSMSGVNASHFALGHLADQLIIEQQKNKTKDV